MDLILLGAPGSGKGTQAERLSEMLGIPHISTGDLFRKNIHEGTELGKRAAQYLNEGTLVPDDVTEGMVRDRLMQGDAKVGFLLDGFPRNLAQGEHLDQLLHHLERRITAALYLSVPRSVLVKRLTGRWLCSQCGATYHVLYNPPKVAGRCDACGGALVQRPDDQEDTVVTRLAVYEEETAPLVGFYRQQGLLEEFDGSRSVDEVTRAIVGRLRIDHD